MKYKDLLFYNFILFTYILNTYKYYIKIITFNIFLANKDFYQINKNIMFKIKRIYKYIFKFLLFSANV